MMERYDMRSSLKRATIELALPAYYQPKLEHTRATSKCGARLGLVALTVQSVSP